MFPAQTSFIPVTVALTKFIETNGFGDLYPYWYFGTTPVKYLIGPVVPGILVAFHKFLPDFSLFDLSLLLVVISGLLAAVGWGVLATGLSGNRIVGWWVGILSLLMPWHWFAAFGLSEVSAVLAASMTPWVLLAFMGSSVNHFKKRSVNLSQKHKTFLSTSLWPSLAINSNLTRFAFWARSVKFLKWFPSLLFAVLILTNTTAAIPAVVGILIISNWSRFLSKNKFQSSNLKKAAMIILIGWLISLVWYGPDFWLTTLGAPSIGGKSAVSAFVNLLNLLRGFVPVILAVILVWWRIQPKTTYDKFVLAWLTVFGSLTLFRFMADPDFWIDWTSWMGEVEIGFALLASQLISNVKLRSFPTEKQMSNFKSLEIGNSAKMFLVLTFLLVGWFLVWQNRDFWLLRKNIEDTGEYRIAKWLEQETGNWELETGNEPTVFLSGSSAFWLNSLVNVVQVRGGRDEVSKNANWRALNWQLTQGENLNDALASLAAQRVDFIVVHHNDSGEYYHDFKSPQDFESIGSLEKVYDDGGDRIYKTISNIK